MSKRFVSATLTAAVLTLAGLTPATAAAQHPADLPLDPRPSCAAFAADPIVDQEKQPTAAVTGCRHLTTSVLTVVRHVWQAVAATPASGIELNFGQERTPEKTGEMLPTFREGSSIRKIDDFVSDKTELFPDGEPFLPGGGLTYEWNGWTGSFRTLCTEPPTVSSTILERDIPPEPAVTVRLKEARHLFLIGERCRVRGDDDMARNCYEEVQRLCPNSNLAAMAEVRLFTLSEFWKTWSDDSLQMPEEPNTTEEEQAAREEVEELARFLRELAEELAQAAEACRPGAQHDGPCYENEHGSPCCPFAHMLPARPVLRETDVQNMKDARDLYLIGEHCRRNGDRDMACRFYKEAMEACPASSYAHKAAVRITQIKLRRAVEWESGVEEAEEPPSPHQRRELRPEPQWYPLVPPATVPPRPADDRQSKAEELFHEAEHCFNANDLERAYAFFQEVHMVCPESLVGRLAIERMFQIEQQCASEMPAEEQEPPKDSGGVGHDRVLDRVLWEITEVPPAITVTTEESSTPATEDSEEQELPAVDRLASVYVPVDPRALRLVGQEDCHNDRRDACLDLSDWLRQLVASRPSGVYLKIDAARLGRLIAEGEGALRCLGCGLVSDGEGRSYVVYPARDGGR